MLIKLCSYVAMGLYGYVARWLCGYVAMWLAMWLRGYMAMWLRGYEAMWLCDYVSMCLCGYSFDLRESPPPLNIPKVVIGLFIHYNLRKFCTWPAFAIQMNWGSGVARRLG